MRNRVLSTAITLVQMISADASAALAHSEVVLPKTDTRSLRQRVYQELGSDQASFRCGNRSRLLQGTAAASSSKMMQAEPMVLLGGQQRRGLGSVRTESRAGSPRRTGIFIPRRWR